MGMSDTTGRTGGGARKATTLQKLQRMSKALRHEEPDRVPISDFFWGGAAQTQCRPRGWIHLSVGSLRDQCRLRLNV